MVVYLAGGINGLTDGEANGWRDEVKTLLPASVSVLDPMCRDYRGVEDANVSDIVNDDLTDIDSSDAIIANCSRPSWGTAMEIHYAATTGTPVIAVVPTGAVSPWLRYHTEAVVTSFAEAVQWVRSL